MTIELTEAEKESLGLYDLGRCPDCNASVAVVEAIAAVKVAEALRAKANRFRRVSDTAPRQTGADLRQAQTYGHVADVLDEAADEYDPKEPDAVL